jgi:hypothetical protein
MLLRSTGGLAAMRSAPTPTVCAKLPSCTLAGLPALLANPPTNRRSVVLDRMNRLTVVVAPTESGALVGWVIGRSLVIVMRNVGNYFDGFTLALKAFSKSELGMTSTFGLCDPGGRTMTIQSWAEGVFQA